MAETSKLPETFYSTNKIDFSKPIDTSNLKEKSTIVTGGASGIGAGVVTAFAEAGAYVTILDRNEELGNALVEKLTAKGLHVQFTKVDIASFSSQTTGFKSAISFSPHKTLDIVVTSAGISTSTTSTKWLASNADNDDPEPPSTATLDVNLTGSFYSAHLALHYFKKTTPEAAPEGDATPQSKQIIFISSLAGYLPARDALDYQASKFGVRGLWKSVRHSHDIVSEHTPFRTNLIAPTFINSPLIERIVPGLKAKGQGVGEVDDVVGGILRVACDEAIYGRAVAIPVRREVAGDRNFDLGDDWEGRDAGPGLVEGIVNGGLEGLQLLSHSSAEGRLKGVGTRG
ncbi:NAD(P)-binding protein [Aaosphaeria arxii CBS 175.79]|uniref:NAD(P)-binding protein n=1 Tax=Aaosphaeria arxii CBS 175.79 TaxID=1450172 RepID=A0A6A5XG87_9PLEO|nr:NAD(P)-binding protein [Aaosphaeria arxii CBS 175.79]KAF2011940.1 NAD(P)-binding protein [Aaosphaeria arxii CBS 175.79]